MNRIRIAPIVEGHGEVAAVPILLRRVWTELLGGEYVEVFRPFRDKRARLAANKQAILTKAVQFSWSRLCEYQNDSSPGLILVLLDADQDQPCILDPEVHRLARENQPEINISCVIAKIVFETWFVAAAESLRAYLKLPSASELPIDPESAGLGKGWIERHFKGAKYSETVDQPKFAASMDLRLCRSQSPSFDKLCRELEAWFQK